MTTDETKGLLNNSAVTSVHFDPRHPAHFIAAFADSTILQFNLFAEDPVMTTISMSPMPWTTYFERHEATDTASGNSGKPGEEGGDGEEINEQMLKWKNDEFGSLGEISRRGKGEERSPWAGRNPLAACKIGRRGQTGESSLYDFDTTPGLNKM